MSSLSTRRLCTDRAYLDGKYVKDDSESGGISMEGDGDSSGFRFLDDDDDAVTDINKLYDNANDNSERIYTVSGQRVKRSEMIKGRVYIIYGRKIAF